LQICAAAQWLRMSDRDQLWQAVARELTRPDVNCVERAIAAAFLTYWQPRTQS
jgi:hypothetical protein